MDAVEAQAEAVCSAHAEVIPPDTARNSCCQCLLRTRGGDPAVSYDVDAGWESAPHTRR